MSNNQRANRILRPIGVIKVVPNRDRGIAKLARLVMNNRFRIRHKVIQSKHLLWERRIELALNALLINQLQALNKLSRIIREHAQLSVQQ